MLERAQEGQNGNKLGAESQLNCRLNWTELAMTSRHAMCRIIASGGR